MNEEVIKGTTCFKEHLDNNISCKRSDCKYWIDSSSDNNCVMISAQKGPKTLQEIGEIFGVTRMRICQIEKSVLSKLISNEKIKTDLYDVKSK